MVVQEGGGTQKHRRQCALSPGQSDRPDGVKGKEVMLLAAVPVSVHARPSLHTIPNFSLWGFLGFFLEDPGQINNRLHKETLLVKGIS